jgi:2-aminoadipate transaminase
MASKSFDFAPLLAPSLPPPAAKWTGFLKYNFTGGNNDAEHVPVDRLIAAAWPLAARAQQAERVRTIALRNLFSCTIGR